MKERRKRKRIKKECEVTIMMISGDQITPSKKISHHLTKDISSGGLKIRTDTFVPINTLLRIELLLTNPPRSIAAFGKVRWSRSLYGDEMFEIGIEFLDTSPDSIKVIKEYIEITTEQ